LEESIITDVTPPDSCIVNRQVLIPMPLVKLSGNLWIFANQRSAPYLKPRLLLVLAMSCLLSGGCRREAAVRTPTVPYVLTVPLKPSQSATLKLSGTIRARYETPIAFQVPGRVLERRVDAGQRVERDALMFRLDPRDFDEAIRAAEAQLRSAEAAYATAKAEHDRQKRLMTENATSQERLERVALAERDSLSGVEAAKANLAQAQNNRSYTELRAPESGIVLEVTTEPGQVVAAGSPVAILARDGDREVEVELPDASSAPLTGRLTLPNGSIFTLELRELAGSADPRSRTWRARYRLGNGVTSSSLAPLALGTVVSVDLDRNLTTPNRSPLYEVPLTAVDERGGGPRVWLVVNGQAKPHSVQVVKLAPETAIISTDLPPTTRVIGVGTHLLTEGMAVREKP
jgi:RND family efflux transporter MFP subunit